MGIPTLKVLACNLTGITGPISPMIKGGRGEIFTALYAWENSGELKELAAPISIKADTWLKDLPPGVHLLGEAAELYAKEIEKILGPNGITYPSLLHIPRAGWVAHLAHKELKENPSKRAGSLIQPIYIRPPAIRMS